MSGLIMTKENSFNWLITWGFAELQEKKENSLLSYMRCCPTSYDYNNLR